MVPDSHPDPDAGNQTANETPSETASETASETGKEAGAASPPAPVGRFQRRFLLVAVVVVSLVFAWMIHDFLVSLLLAALAAALVEPVHQRLLRAVGGRRVLAASLITVGTLLLVVGPLTTLLGLVVAQAVQITEAATPWVEQQLEQPERLRILVERLPLVERLGLDNLLPDPERLVTAAGNAVNAVGSFLVGAVAAAGKLTARFFLQLFIFLYAMFFFLLDGRRLLERILYYAPLGREDEALIVGRFVSVTRATLKGSLVIGALQGLLAGLAFWVAGVPGAAFWGSIMMVLSVIPGAGAPLVWIPAVAWLIVGGQLVPGIGLTAWCAVVVGSIDNVLRPRLVGSDAKMSDLMILLSTLGGISLLGAAGIVVGPIIAAVFVTLWDVYGRTFRAELPPIGEPGS